MPLWTVSQVFQKLTLIASAEPASPALMPAVSLIRAWSIGWIAQVRRQRCSVLGFPHPNMCVPPSLRERRASFAARRSSRKSRLAKTLRSWYDHWRRRHGNDSVPQWI